METDGIHMETKTDICFPVSIPYDGNGLNTHGNEFRYLG
jgi:hypothetical protein